MVPTGGELTRFEAVGRLEPDFLVFCRSSPVGDVWRDLIDAWQRLQQAVSTRRPPLEHQEEDEVMIVRGADTHKRSQTVAAIAAGTGELLGEQTVAVGRRGFGVLLRWARSLDG